MEGTGPVKRVRLWPHTPDIFATFVSFPVSPPSPALCALRDAVAKAASSAWQCAVTPCEELHVSVTRTLPIRKNERARLTQRLSAAIASSDTCAFVAEAKNLVVLTNDSHVTSFVALVLEAEELEELTLQLDRELASLGQPVFPCPHVFHVSLAWADGDWSSDEHAMVLKDLVSKMAIDEHKLALTECVLRVGDVLHTFSLPAALT